MLSNFERPGIKFVLLKSFFDIGLIFIIIIIFFVHFILNLLIIIILYVYIYTNIHYRIVDNNFC